jgi:hypothetical protein
MIRDLFKLLLRTYQPVVKHYIRTTDTSAIMAAGKLSKVLYMNATSFDRPYTHRQVKKDIPLLVWFMQLGKNKNDH